MCDTCMQFSLKSTMPGLYLTYTNDWVIVPYGQAQPFCLHITMFFLSDLLKKDKGSKIDSSL